MAVYRIHRLRDHARQHFRWAPHLSGRTAVKPRDYLDPDAGVEAASPYSAWSSLRASARPLEVGDLLEAPDGSLLILKYVGFDEAAWVLPEPKPQPEAVLPGVN